MDDWLLDALQILSFTCEMLAALRVRLQVSIERGLRTFSPRTVLVLLKKLY